MSYGQAPPSSEHTDRRGINRGAERSQRGWLMWLVWSIVWLLSLVVGKVYAARAPSNL